MKEKTGLKTLSQRLNGNRLVRFASVMIATMSIMVIIDVLLRLTLIVIGTKSIATATVAVPGFVMIGLLVPICHFLWFISKETGGEL